MVVAQIYRHKKLPLLSPVQVPVVLAYIVFLAAAFLVLVPLISDPQWGMLFAVLFILAGLIFYFPLVHFEREVPCMRKLERKILPWTECPSYRFRSA